MSAKDAKCVFLLRDAADERMCAVGRTRNLEAFENELVTYGSTFRVVKWISKDECEDLKGLLKAFRHLLGGGAASNNKGPFWFVRDSASVAPMFDMISKIAHDRK